MTGWVLSIEKTEDRYNMLYNHMLVVYNEIGKF